MKIKSCGVGIGLRRENAAELLAKKSKSIQCLEIAPENFMKIGGKHYRQFRQLAEIYPIVVHGLSLSLGSKTPLKKDFLKDLKQFLRKHNIPWMSDHLCYSSLHGAQFHDLLPLPFSEEALRNAVRKIKQVQDYLEMPFAVENISYYAPGGAAEMSEWEFVSRVAEEANCSLLLDINNIYVNSINHQFDAMEYLRRIPYQRVLHMHLAGHTEYEGFLLDNHGADIIDPVWRLFAEASRHAKPAAVIIERDHHVPSLSEQIIEVKRAQKFMKQGEKRILSSVIKSRRLPARAA